jgi:hypothetical protein
MKVARFFPHLKLLVSLTAMTVLLASCSPLGIQFAVGEPQPGPRPEVVPRSEGVADGNKPVEGFAVQPSSGRKTPPPPSANTSTPEPGGLVDGTGVDPALDSSPQAADSLNTDPSADAVVAAAASGCASSSPATGEYTVTVCFTTPASGATLSGVANSTAVVTVSGTNPGVRRIVFYLNGAYLLTDYQSTYTFSLPTQRWVDGSYKLEVNALMRDGFHSTKAPLNVTFKNGVTSTPVNNNEFSPSTGRSGSPFVVMATGDGASGELNAGKVITLIQNANPNLFLYLGDVYEKGSAAEFYNWYGVNGAYFDRFRSITDPTIGNHEYTASSSAAGYFDYWDNVPNYYSFDAGGWHFISLNSNSNKISVASGSEQYNWLHNDLVANTGKCTIVYYHHPVFNIGPEGPTTALSAIWSLMAQYKVTLAINGHDHDYQRWVPLNGSGEPSPTGITEFVAGGGGHGVQTIANSDSRVAYSNNSNPAALGVLKLTLSSTAAQFSYLSINGSVLDSGSVSCEK